MSKNKFKLQLIFASNQFLMKKNILLITCFLFIFCSEKEHDIIGFWNVESNYYRATYKIENKNNKLIGKVIYYNDDTTILKETHTDKDIFLFNLKLKKDNIYVDAVSGATSSKNQNTIIKVNHKDTLEVTSYIMKKPLKEIWIRNTNNIKKNE